MAGLVSCASVTSAERVGKTAESLNAYKDVVLSLKDNCSIAKSIQTPEVAATPAKIVCDRIEADEKSWGRALKMLIDYGGAMTKLAAKPKLNGEDATSTLLSVAEKLEWHTLSADSTAALSKAAGILVQWLAREIRRDELVTQAKKVNEDIQAATTDFQKNLGLHLDTLCIANNALLDIRRAPCMNEPCPVLVEAGRQATLEHLRVELSHHRLAAINMSVSLAGFAAAHAAFVVGADTVGRPGDSGLAKKISAEAERVGKDTKKALTKYVECNY